MRTALLIDGGHLRVIARKRGFEYNPTFIEHFSKQCVIEQEFLLRIMYYDCPLYRGEQVLPVSGGIKKFSTSDKWLDDLASRELFAVRTGNLVFRGWSLRKPPTSGHELSDDDFYPNFEQKGVDMRIGLDIATFADERTVERIILVSADADMLPALKHARKKGVQVVAVQLPQPAYGLPPKFLAHTDFCRRVLWPADVAAAPSV